VLCGREGQIDRVCPKVGETSTQPSLQSMLNTLGYSPRVQTHLASVDELRHSPPSWLIADNLWFSRRGTWPA
jgi:hypothetical protein